MSEQIEKVIIHGRMPVAVVFLARFGAMSVRSTKEKSDIFATTIGKIDDIAKSRNFAYVTSDFKPSAKQKAEAKAWLERHPTGASELIQELDALPDATEEEMAAFEAVREKARGQKAVDAEGNPVAAGGGNRRKGGKKAKAEAEAVNGEEAQDVADALLS